MHKQDSREVLVFAGIDVSARELMVAVQVGDKLGSVRSFANAAAGHRQLQQYLRSHGQRIRVCWRRAVTTALTSAWHCMLTSESS